MTENSKIPVGPFTPAAWLQTHLLLRKLCHGNYGTLIKIIITTARIGL